jgi:uncharacterized membrane protein
VVRGIAYRHGGWNSLCWLFNLFLLFVSTFGSVKYFSALKCSDVETVANFLFLMLTIFGSDCSVKTSILKKFRIGCAVVKGV